MEVSDRGGEDLEEFCLEALVFSVFPMMSSCVMKTVLSVENPASMGRTATVTIPFSDARAS